MTNVIDIAASKHRNADASGAMLRCALRAAGALAWIWDPREDEVRCDDGAAGSASGNDALPVVRLHDWLSKVHLEDRGSVAASLRGLADGLDGSVAPKDLSFGFRVSGAAGIRAMTAHAQAVRGLDGSAGLIVAALTEAAGRERPELPATPSDARTEHPVVPAGERFQTAVDAMIDCFGLYTAVRDEDGRIRDFRIDYVNRAACEHLAMPSGQQVGALLCELLPGHRGSGLFRQYCEVVETGVPLIEESRVYEDDLAGRRIFGAYDIRAVRHGDGFAAVWRDVTERHRRRAELEAARELLENLVLHAPVAIFAKDLDGRFLFANEKTLRILDASPEDLLGRTADDILPAGTFDALALNDRQVIEAGGPLEFEETIEHGGKVHQFLAVKFPLYNRDREVCAVCGVATDVSDHRAAEAALAESEARLRLAVHAATIGIWSWDLITDRVYLSPECAEIGGLGAFSGTSVQLQRFLPPDDAKRARAAVKESLVQHGVFNCEFRVNLEDGEVKWLLNVGRPEYDAAGRPIRMLGIAKDITERKLYQLEREAADARKDDFLAMLSHELRNFLSPVRHALLALQLAGQDTERQARLLAIVGRQTDNLQRLVDDLMDTTRIANGKVELQRVDVSLQDLARQAVEVSRPAIEARRHSLSIDVPGEPMRFSGDPVRLCQMVSNLLLNAAKYTDDGGHIRLAARLQDRTILIEVKDDGIGIEPDHLRRIFDLFTQVDTSHRGGLGIGLYLVKQIAELHDGTVQAHSAGYGQGSRFTVKLPLMHDAVR